MKKWDIESRELVGSRHKEKGLLCQDGTACQMAEGRLAVALVDATGKTDTSSKNSRGMAQLLSHFLLEHYEDIRHSDEEDISYNLMCRIEKEILEKSQEYGLDKQEFASTLLGLVIDTSSEAYYMIHLGDGLIAVQDEKENIYQLSEPENGRKLKETILSTSEIALKHLRICHGHLNKIRQFILVSDGIYTGYYDMEKIEEIFRNENPHDILKESDDDQAYIKIAISE